MRRPEVRPDPSDLYQPQDNSVVWFYFRMVKNVSGFVWCSACNKHDSWLEYSKDSPVSALLAHVQSVHSKSSPKILSPVKMSPRPSIGDIKEQEPTRVPFYVFERSEEFRPEDIETSKRRQFPNGIVWDPKHSHNTTLVWDSCPRRVLLVHKLGDKEAFNVLRKVAQYLCRQAVEAIYLCEDIFHDVMTSSSPPECSKIRQFDREEDSSSIDICICLGGDGTLLFVNALLQTSSNLHPIIPPMVAFSLGSLGFLTNFDAGDFESVLAKIFVQEKQPISVVFRDRLRISIMRASGECEHVYHALNELVVDRGMSSYLCSFELYVNEELVTIIQSDGIILSTATGSTAYSLSAGGPMIPPSVSAMIMTPICPHTLSFRPTVLPDSCSVRIKLPCDSANVAFASMDGQNGIALSPGDYVDVKMSRFPFPCVCSANSTSDWFESIKSRLFWNLRVAQKPRRSHSKTESELEFDE